MSEALTHIYVVRNAQGVIVRARESAPPLDPMPQGWTVDRLPLATPEAGLEMARTAFAEAARWSDQAPLVEERARMYRADGTWSEEEYLEWKGEHDAWARDVAEQFEDFVKRYHADAARAARTEAPR